MTLDEAITNLEKERDDHHSLSTDLTGQALVLGIEALEFFRIHQGHGHGPFSRTLPSQTEY